MATSYMECKIFTRLLAYSLTRLLAHSLTRLLAYFFVSSAFMRTVLVSDAMLRDANGTATFFTTSVPVAQLVRAPYL